MLFLQVPSVLLELFLLSLPVEAKFLRQPVLSQWCWRSPAKKMDIQKKELKEG